MLGLKLHFLHVLGSALAHKATPVKIKLENLVVLDVNGSNNSESSSDCGKDKSRGTLPAPLNKNALFTL